MYIERFSVSFAEREALAGFKFGAACKRLRSSTKQEDIFRENQARAKREWERGAQQTWADWGNKNTPY